MYLKSINPDNGEIVREFEEFHWDEIDTIIEKNSTVFKTWKKTSFSERASYNFV